MTSPSLRSLLFVLTVLLAGALPAAVLTYDWRALNRTESVVLEQAKNRLLVRTYGRDTAAALTACPAHCAYFAVFLLLLTPLAAIGFAAPKRDGTDPVDGRFYTLLRGSSAALGITTLQAVTALAVLYAGWCAWTWLTAPLDVARAALAWTPRLFGVNAVYALAFVGLASLVRVVTRSAAANATAACGAVVVLWFVHTVARVVGSPFASVLPNGLDGVLLSNGGVLTVRVLVIAMSWTTAFFAAGLAVAAVRRAS